MLPFELTTDQFDYLKVTSNPSTTTTSPTTRDNTPIVASIAAVIGVLVLIGLIVLWLFYQRRRRGVRVIVPRDPFLLANHPRRTDSPPAHITPFYETPRYAKLSHTESDGNHEEVLLLAGTQATGDRKKKYSVYNVPETPGSSHSLRDPQGPQTASTLSVNVTPRRSSPQPTMATYAPSTKGGIREAVYSGMPPTYAQMESEDKGLPSAPSTQTAPIIPLRPLRPSPAPSPAQPILQRMSLYHPPVSGAETSQKKRRM